MKEKKILFSILSMICISFSSLGLSSCEKSTKGLEFTLFENEYWVTGYTGKDTHVTIPSVYKNKPVTGIRGASLFAGTGVDDFDGAFEGCSSLTSITIPDSVTSIGFRAFVGCISLESINIPDNVTVIEENTFTGCKSLTSITIPDSVTSIGSSAFAYCNSLKNITIPDSVTSIGGEAFGYCTSLTSVIIGNNVTRIDRSAFIGCSSLKSITIPDSVTVIGDYAFYGCDSLETVYFTGTEKQWQRIYETNWLSGCESLLNSTFVYNYKD